MDRSHLASLYESGRYADCTIVSGQGDSFEAHRFVLSQCPQLTELIDDDRVIHLTESTEVTERLLRWMYGVEWPEINIELTRAGSGDELMEILSVCDAAEKVSLRTNITASGVCSANHRGSMTSPSSETKPTTP